jgi:hypothetical protein
MLALYGNLELVHKFYFSLQRAAIDDVPRW